MSLADTKSHLRSLLGYTRELLDFRRKVVLDLADTPYPVFHEGEILLLEGVSAAPDPDAWLQVKRLKETIPPAPDPMFEGWYSKVPHPSPNVLPKLIDDRMLRLPNEEISDLIESGLLDPADVLRPRDAYEDLPPQMDAILRVSRMPEFRRAWEDYVAGPWKRWAETEKPRRRSIEVYNRLFAIHQRSMSAGEDGAIETVWGIGLARCQLDGSRINVPIIEQLVPLHRGFDGLVVGCAEDGEVFWLEEQLD